MSGIQLRPYQLDAIQAVIEARRAGIRRQLVCLPTGAGKTVIFSELAARAKRPVLVLAHRAELLEQAKEKLEAALDGRAVVGIEQAERRAPRDAKVVVASIRSLGEARLDDLLARWTPGLVIYDESHHAPADDNRRVLAQLGVFEEGWDGTLLGVTATALRADGVPLQGVFEEVVYAKTLSSMIEEGYLAPLHGYRVDTGGSIEEVGLTRSDFRVDELAERVDVEERNALVARSLLELARDRRSLVFCVNVKHARSLARDLGRLGIPAEALHAQTPKDERRALLERFREGGLRVLTNVAVLTEGFDDPGVSCIAMARPTRSSGLYAQCVGRGLRLAPGKRNCLVLDFVDLSSLPLQTLPSLFGMPFNTDLQGEDVREASEEWMRIVEETPGFELGPESITLEEIQERARRFDPLTLEVDQEVRAISAHAWMSLGRAGLVLHFLGRQRRRESFAVVHIGKGAERYHVLHQGRKVAAFSAVEEAVEAVDYEVRRRGKAAARSAFADAAWRQDPVPEELADRLRRLRPPRTAANVGEALTLLAFATHTAR